jgi:uncharacterized protein YraI
VKKLLLGAAAVVSLMLAPSIADAAVRGYATANVNMRSGPSTGYPAVTVIPYGASVTIYGCMSSVNWCDIAFVGGRGWVSGNYVQASYQSNRVYVAPDYYGGLGIPLVTFDVDRYWGTYYRDRNFYRERDRWRDYNWRAERPLPPPPRWDRDRDRDRWDNNRDRDRDRDRDRPRGDNNDRRPPPPGWDRGDRDRDRDRDRDHDRDRDRDRDRPRGEEQRPPRTERPQREEQRPPRAERQQRDEQPRRRMENNGLGNPPDDTTRRCIPGQCGN